MRSYEDISERIMQRGDEILKKRRMKAARIRHSSYAFSGICAAVIVGVGIWFISMSFDIGKDSLSGINIVTDDSIQTTDKPQETEKGTDYNQNTSTVSSAKSVTTTKTLTTKSISSTEAAYTTHISTSITDITAPDNTVPSTHITSTLQQTQTTPEIELTTQMTTVADLQEVTFPVQGENESVLIDQTAWIDQYITSKFNKIVIGSINVEESSGINNAYYIFTSFSMDKSKTDIMTESTYVTSLNSRGAEPERLSADIYSVKGFNTNDAIALKYGNRPGYYLYTNPYLEHSALEDLINDFSNVNVRSTT